MLRHEANCSALTGVADMCTCGAAVRALRSRYASNQGHERAPGAAVAAGPDFLETRRRATGLVFGLGLVTALALLGKDDAP